MNSKLIQKINKNYKNLLNFKIGAENSDMAWTDF